MHLRDMAFLKVESLVEAFAAEVTLKVSASDMDLGVLAQIGALREGLVTCGAHVGLRPRVHAQVVDEVAPLLEDLAACLAAVRFRSFLGHVVGVLDLSSAGARGVAPNYFSEGLISRRYLSPQFIFFTVVRSGGDTNLCAFRVTSRGAKAFALNVR